MPSPNIKIKVYSELSPELLEQSNELGALCFAPQSPDDQKVFNDKFWNRNIFLFIAALDGTRLVGRTKLLKREIEYRDKKIILGGLGGVCTAPEYRKKGIGTALITRAMKELKKTDCDICYLCTDIKDENKVRLYGKVGFVKLNKPHSFYGKSGKLYTEHDGMIAPVNSKRIFEEIISTPDTFHIGNGNW